MGVETVMVIDLYVIYLLLVPVLYRIEGGLVASQADTYKSFLLYNVKQEVYIIRSRDPQIEWSVIQTSLS